MQLSPTPLHVPDGFFSLTVSLISWVITFVMIWIAIRKTQKDLDERQIPFMGIMAAFIFAAQMINFPVAGGTSGHLLGGALTGIILGPWAGMLVMTSVISLQALMFQDGGLLVMGANILNMGLITTLIGFGLYRPARQKGKNTRMFAAGLAAWVSVVAGALLAAFELWISGTSPASLVFPAMLGIHAIIGIGEALITVGVISFLTKVQPGLMSSASVESRGGRGWVVAGGIISLAVVFLSPFASTNPDGLVRIANDLNFLSQSQNPSFKLLSNYLIPALGDSALSKILAGGIGVVIVFGIVILIGRGLRRPQNQKP